MQNYTKNQVEKIVLSLVTEDKAKEILDSLKKSGKKTKGKKSVESQRITLKTETIRLISEKPLTLLEVVNELVKLFPEYDSKKNPEKYVTLLATTKRRLKGEEFENIKITKDSDGKYFTKSKISGLKKPEKTEKPKVEMPTLGKLAEVKTA